MRKPFETIVAPSLRYDITEPMPSMPLFFWNDPEMKRYQAGYVSMFPGIWRHGDWLKINERNGGVI
jgi:acetoacetyl-CoA synthetase